MTTSLTTLQIRRFDPYDRRRKYVCKNVAPGDVFTGKSPSNLEIKVTVSSIVSARCIDVTVSEIHRNENRLKKGQTLRLRLSKASEVDGKWHYTFEGERHACVLFDVHEYAKLVGKNRGKGKGKYFPLFIAEYIVPRFRVRIAKQVAADFSYRN